MNLKLSFLYLSLLLIISCNRKEIQIVDKAIGFSMNLPGGFQKLDQRETDQAINLGKEKFKKIYNADLDISNLKPNIFEKDRDNYFVLNIKDYNPQIEGDYSQAVYESNIQLYNTYRQNFTGAKIDTLTAHEKIDQIDFTKFSVSIDIPNKAKMQVVSYTSFIKNKDFTASVVYLDEEIGNEMINALKKAKFKKTAP
ncbi:hypothetical protein ACM46_20455 [Chryseobacterium angstadtii]|uniref:Lipoprotein n=1 Tax=Chryseobacterium angstadtii TaxID=558151 RepID=A0A0J7KQD9_9FLAO|nr:hypothetical protein [Chryseobacterium angstadtii]KMQ59465.1 hypothetical protein ACM46_20455 [Chryseobacterium angstadtii]